MQMRKLGSQGPEISVVGYGAWEIGGDAYGPNPDEKDIFAAINAALEGGMNWIDTAEIYGSGHSETLVGKLLKGRREEALIATKVFPGDGSRFKPEGIREAIEGSLKRLGTDYVDLYQLHWAPAGEWNIEETWGTMSALVDEGLVRHIGVSNLSKEQIERCLKVRHVDSLQPQFSMFHRDHEELISWCGEVGVGVVPYGPLAYGLLTGAVSRDTKFHEDDWRGGKWPNHSYYVALFAADKLPGHLSRVENLKPLAAKAGLTLGQLALAWANSRPGVTSSIAGSRSVAHNKENAKAGDASLSEDLIDQIEKVLTA